MRPGLKCHRPMSQNINFEVTQWGQSEKFVNKKACFESDSLSGEKTWTSDYYIIVGCSGNYLQTLLGVECFSSFRDETPRLVFL